MSKAKTNADELDLSSDETATTSTTEETVSTEETTAEETTSSAKSAETETVAETVAEEVTEEATVQDASSSGENSTMAATNKMSLSKFLRLHPQNIYVTALLQKYRSKAMTEQEWLDLIDELMNQKVTG